MLNVSDNNVSVIISYNECFGVNFVPSATYDISVNFAVYIHLRPPESSKCFLCWCDMYVCM